MVMFDVAVVAAVGALALVVRWLVQRQSTADGFPAISVGCCAVLAVVASLPVVVRADLDSRLSRDASKLIGAHVEVNCQTLTGSAVDMGRELGYVKWGPGGVPEHKTLIKHQQCNDLESYLDSKKRHPSAAEILAVHVLTHESMHMAGNTNEAITECYAMQHDTAMAEIMGAAPADAHALAVTYWKTVYPLMPDGYTSRECRQGGSLDLHLPDAPWAT
jgi:hypothetical protein